MALFSLGVIIDFYTICGYNLHSILIALFIKFGASITIAQDEKVARKRSNCLFLPR